MYQANLEHLQPSPISDISMMAETQRVRLEQSWAAPSREYCFKQIEIKEAPFAVLYND